MPNNNEDDDYDVPRGPEDIPLKGYIKLHSLVILVTDIKSRRVIREERINYSDPNARRWLGKLSYWGSTNGYSITTMSEKDYDDVWKVVE